MGSLLFCCLCILNYGVRFELTLLRYTAADGSLVEIGEGRQTMVSSKDSEVLPPLLSHSTLPFVLSFGLSMS